MHGIVPGPGGWPNVYVFIIGSFFVGEKKAHIKQNPPKIPGRSRENRVYVFFFMCFSLPNIRKRVEYGFGEYGFKHRAQ